jgi:hypothetical protein
MEGSFVAYYAIIIAKLEILVKPLREITLLRQWLWQPN